MYNSRGHAHNADGLKYGRFGHTCGGFEYHCAICASSSLSHVSGNENQSSNNAIKSPSICVEISIKLFVKLSLLFRINYEEILRLRLIVVDKVLYESDKLRVYFAKLPNFRLDMLANTVFIG